MCTVLLLFQWKQLKRASAHRAIWKSCNLRQRMHAAIMAVVFRARIWFLGSGLLLVAVQKKAKMIQGYGPVMQAFLGTLFTWGLTAAGAALVLVIRGSQVSNYNLKIDKQKQTVFHWILAKIAWCQSGIRCRSYDCRFLLEFVTSSHWNGERIKDLWWKWTVCLHSCWFWFFSWGAFRLRRWRTYFCLGGSFTEYDAR